MSVTKFCAVSLTFLLLLSQGGCGGSGSGGSDSSAGGSLLSGSDSASGTGTTSTASTGGATSTNPTTGTTGTAGTAVIGGPSSLPDGTASAVGAPANGTTSGGTAAGGVAATGVAKLTWDVTPSVATGYKVYYGSSPKTYSSSVAVGNVPSFSVSLPPGTYYFAVTAYDSAGNESGYSNEVSKTI
jgi:hypothetical protein